MSSHTPTAYVNANGRVFINSKPFCLKRASYTRLWQRRFCGNGSRKDLPHHCSRTACRLSSSTARATNFTTRATAAPPMPSTHTQLHEDNPSSSPSTPPFSWERNWWPIMPLSYLDPTRPTAAELLGIPLVLWRDGSGTWRCFQDLCPHRLAPLTEGRIEDGQLMCSYHGWRFEGGGSCTTIPQAPDAKTHSVATSSPRACARAFPTKEAYGLLWVWPDASPSAAEDSAAAVAVATRYMKEREAKGQRHSWYMRDVPYSYQILVENGADPSHLPYSHHKHSPSSNANRYTAGPMTFTRVTPEEEATSPASSPDVPSVAAYAHPSQVSPESRIRFIPPAICTDEYQYPTHTMVIELYAVPTGPDRARLLMGGGKVASNSAAAKPSSLLDTIKSKYMLWKASKVPHWKGHLIAHTVFDGDNSFLAAQQRNLRTKELEAAAAVGSSSQMKSVWKKEYFMPISCDRAVVDARKWIDTVGGGGPQYPAGAAPTSTVSKRELLDRWEQHGRNCPHCQEAVRNLNISISAATGVLAAATFALLALLLRNGPLGLLSGGQTSLAAAVTVLVAAAAAAARRKWADLLQQFFYVDYNHADRD